MRLLRATHHALLVEIHLRIDYSHLIGHSHVAHVHHWYWTAHGTAGDLVAHLIADHLIVEIWLMGRTRIATLILARHDLCFC